MSNPSRVDYEKIANFWRETTRGAKKSLDYTAGQNPIIPEEAHQKFRVEQMRFFFDSVLPKVSAESDVLDLGCGPGTWALQVAPKVKSVLGIDIAPAFIEHATREAERQGVTNVSFQEGSFLTFKTERRFGLIVLGAMLVYVNDDDLVPLFERLRGFLAPGGIIYARTSVAPRRRYARLGKYQGIYRTKAQYEEAMREAGFTIESERDLAYTNASLLAAYFGAAYLASLGMIRFAPSLSQRLYHFVEEKSALTYDAARTLIDLTPAPLCYHFLLRPSQA